MSEMAETKELAPGITLEVTRRTEGMVMMTVEVMSIDKRSVTVRVGDQTKNLMKGDILKVSVPWA